MKKWLKAQASRLFHTLATHAVLRGNLADLPRRAAIVPPAAPGSVGDAAMIAATVATLRAQGYAGIDLFHSGPWPLDAPVDAHVATDDYFYRGAWFQQLCLLAKLRRYTDIFLIGADVIDGAYNPGSVGRRIALVAAAVRSGRRGTVLGASYNEAPHAGTRAALAHAPVAMRLCARDPVSCVRLEHAIGRAVEPTADLAFLLPSRPEEPAAAEALRWIATRRAAGDRVVALNANYLQFAKLPALATAYATLARELVAQGCSLLLVPHDSRTDRPDVHHLREATAGLDESRLHVIDTVSPGAIKAALARIDMLVTGRLHALILALGSGTPAVALAYQGKFEGVMQMFGLPLAEWTTMPEAFVEAPVGFARHTLAQAARSDELRRTVLARLPEAEALARRNFG